MMIKIVYLQDLISAMNARGITFMIVLTKNVRMRYSIVR